MKTAELTGAMLNYWVAKTLYNLPRHEFRLALLSKAVLLRNLETGVDVVWSPSTDWAQGGPIIEMESIKMNNHPEVGFRPMSEWSARCFNGPLCIGPTLLIAAMRAYVASKYGDEVPDL